MQHPLFFILGQSRFDRCACSVGDGPASLTLSMQPDIFGQSSRQKVVQSPFGITSQLTDRLPPVREQPSANPPTPPALNNLSPTPSIHSTKVEAHTPLPPRSVLLKLVEIYFTHVNNQTYGFLHRPTFLRHIEEGKVPDGLLYSICAISARFSTTHAPPPFNPASQVKKHQRITRENRTRSRLEN